MTDCLYWDHDLDIVVPITLEREGGYTVAVPAAACRFCVNLSKDIDDRNFRYGMWLYDGFEFFEWVTIPKHSFPKKFLAALLILGVP